jgi:tryptophan synthase alpha chain
MPVQNRLTHLFITRPRDLLSVYFTAGYPSLNSVLDTAFQLQEAGVDFLEIGFPYSDPLADGPVIQKSSQEAIHNGMNLNVLFDQIQEIRKTIHIPLLLMGYVNPVLQYGMERFLKSCSESGIDGLILPDLPMVEYETLYKGIFESYNLSNIFLVTPQSSESRIRKIDELTEGFIYLLSSSSTTGQTVSLKNTTPEYLKRIESMGLRNPLMVGFGISNAEAFRGVCAFTSGAIVGTAFIRAQNEGISVQDFIKTIRN